jgi:hypothetical protein
MTTPPIILHVHPESSFTMLSNDMLRNPALSAKAKGLLAYMLSMASGYSFSADRMAAHFTDGPKAIRSGLTELEAQHYLRRPRHRNPDGTFRTAVHVFARPEWNADSPAHTHAGMPANAPCVSSCTLGSPAAPNGEPVATAQAASEPDTQKGKPVAMGTKAPIAAILTGLPSPAIGDRPPVTGSLKKTNKENKKKECVKGTTRGSEVTVDPVSSANAPDQSDAAAAGFSWEDWSDDVRTVAAAFAEVSKANGWALPTTDALRTVWATHTDRLLRIGAPGWGDQDHLNAPEVEDVLAVIRWVGSGAFWTENVRSLKSLHEKWEQASSRASKDSGAATATTALADVAIDTDDFWGDSDRAVA